MLAAHSANGGGVRHALADHLRGTSALARQFGDAFGAGDLAAYLGLVHDVGKASCGWQERLAVAEVSGGPVGGDHKMAGTWLASQMAGVFAMAVHGHHGGLPAGAMLKNQLSSPESAKLAEWEDAITKIAALVPEITPAIRPALPSWLAGNAAKDSLLVDLLVRMVFSCLVDADFLDTEAHFRGTPRPSCDLMAGDLVDRYEEGRADLLDGVAPSPADDLRQLVYDEAVAAAARPPGLYRLPAPTGSGKTLAAGGFALRQARAHELARVVVAVPFISITEQNAQVYRRLLDRVGEAPVVLEHHSAVDLNDRAKGASTRWWWRKLASENWDAPFVVTTTVRLFESLFDNRPAAMRKLHRLARAVIVLDEVQALPDRLLLPILSALQLLTEHFGTTVLLASATQPSYWTLGPFQGQPVRDVIANPDHLYVNARRVRWQWQLTPKPTLRQVATQMASEPQVLAVVNTTTDSAALHRYLDEYRSDSLGPCLHLSTRMTARHRHDVLDAIGARLGAGQPLAVVSTQLIEAGVDLDFPAVYRAWAPADSLQQAAGRCNRSARLREGRVVVFDPEDGGCPADSYYKAALHATASNFGPGLADPDDQATMDRYYRERYTRQNLEASGPGAKVQSLRQQLDFPAVAEAFRMIEDHTVPVAVEYGDGKAGADVRDLISRLRDGSSQQAGQAAALLRRLQPYLATVPKSLVRKAEAVGYTEPVIGDLLFWRGPYHPQRGIEPTTLSGPDPTEVHIW